MVCFIPCFYLSTNFFSYFMYMFLGFEQEAWPPVFCELFLLFVGFSFLFSIIVYIHLSLGQEA